MKTASSPKNSPKAGADPRGLIQGSAAFQDPAQEIAAFLETAEAGAALQGLFQGSAAPLNVARASQRRHRRSSKTRHRPAPVLYAH